MLSYDKDAFINNRTKFPAPGPNLVNLVMNVAYTVMFSFVKNQSGQQ